MSSVAETSPRSSVGSWLAYIAGVALIVIGVLSGLGKAVVPSSYTVSTEMIQQRVAERVGTPLPIKSPRAAKYFKSVTITSADVKLSEGRIDIAATSEGVMHIPVLGDKPFYVSLAARGIPRLSGSSVFFVIEEQSLEIKRVTINEHTIEGNFRAYAEKYFTGGLLRFFGDRAKWVEDVTLGYAESVGERMSHTRPIYTIPGWKGTLASWALTGLEVHPSGVEVKFSIGTLLWNLVVWIGLGTLVIGIVIILVFGLGMIA
jgi:hypothetical protein